MTGLLHFYEKAKNLALLRVYAPTIPCSYVCAEYLFIELAVFLNKRHKYLQFSDY